MTTYTLVEEWPGRYLIVDGAGALCGFCPTLRGYPGAPGPVVEGVHPSLAWFPFEEALATVRRWLGATQAGQR